MMSYNYVVEKCSDTGLYVGYVPDFPGVHSQAETLDELRRNMQEVVELLADSEVRSHIQSIARDSRS